jgi:3-oxoacyl-[acyl-carrier protein] reductase
MAYSGLICLEESGAGPLYAAINLSRDELQEFGRIDILIDNLGDFIRKPLVALPGTGNATQALADDEIQFAMDINLTEAVLCTRAVGPRMLERRAGKVIHISSWATRRSVSAARTSRSAARSGVAGPLLSVSRIE